MDTAFKAMTGAAVAASFLMVTYRPHMLLFSRPTYLGTFVQFWFLEVLAWAFYKVVLYPRYFSPMRHLPGPSGGTFFNGQFHRIRDEPSGAPMLEWLHTVPNNGIIRYLGILNAERVFITSAKGLSEILTTKAYDWRKPAQVSRAIGRILGIGVLLAEGEEHKAQRKSLMPAFAFRHVKDLYPKFWSKSREGVLAMVEQIRLDAGKPKAADVEKSPIAADQAVMEVGEWASRITLDIIGVAGLGKDFEAIKNPDSTLYSTYSVVFKPSRQAQVIGLLNIFLPSWLVQRLPIKRNEDVQEAAKLIRQTCRELIHSKKEKLEKKELTEVDILSVALESASFTEENLIDQLMTFLAAGHETTATATLWAVYLLCVHPEVQTRLRAEIRSHLPPVEVDKDISSLEIDHMPYLNAVCSEVLRYFPPVPMTLREAAVDTTICGEFIPAGTRAFIAPWATNKDRSLWGEDADKFRPDRWMSDGTLNPHAANGGASTNYANLTFLHGPRSCIGQAFARAEFACLLAAWIGRLEFELNNVAEMDEENLVIKAGVTARPAKGMWVKARVLDGW